MSSIRFTTTVLALASAALLGSAVVADARMTTTVPANAADGSPLQTLINQDRAAAGLGPLGWSACLAIIAQQNAQRIANQGYLSHTDGPTTDLGCGVGATSAGENIAYISSGVNDPQVNTMYMNSPGHKANILGAYNFVATAWVVAPDGSGYNAEEFLAAQSLVGVSPPPPAIGPWSLVGGTATSAPAVATSGSRMDVVVRGTDNQLWHRTFDGTNWLAWESLGGVSTTEPAAVSWGAGRLDVFVRGVDNQLWHRSADNGTWNAWEPLGGVLTAAPAVASWGAGRLDVFVRGTDKQLWRRSYDAGAWGPWSNTAGAGGVLSTRPSAVSWGTGRIDIFVGGMDGQLWHMAIDGSTVSAWEPLGGVLGSGPASASSKSGRLDVFVRGVDGRLWHRTWMGGWASWTDADNNGGGLKDAPAAAGTNAATTQIVVRGADDALWHEVISTP